jgi:hypothetical protein
LTKRPQIDASVGFFDEFVCPTVPPQIAARFEPRKPQPGWLCGATVFSRQDFERVGPFDPTLRIGAWIDWVDRARLSGVVFDVTEALVLHRRLHPGSLSTMSQSPQNRNGAFLALARNALNRRREQQS